MIIVINNKYLFLLLLSFHHIFLRIDGRKTTEEEPQMLRGEETFRAKHIVSRNILQFYSWNKSEGKCCRRRKCVEGYIDRKHIV